MKKTLVNYKKTWIRETKGRNQKFKGGLKLGLLATTNNKKIRKWLKSKET